MTVLTAYCHVSPCETRDGTLAEAWLAGLLFAWSPLLVTRGMGHFSLVAAAPLAIFLLVLLKADGHERFRDALALGAAMWMAASTDVYYAVYCLLIGAVFLAARVLSIHRSPRSGRDVAVRWTLDVLILCAAALVGALVVGGGGRISLLGLSVSMRSLYTPMLVLTTLAGLRIAWAFRASLRTERSRRWMAPDALRDRCRCRRHPLLSPVLYAVGVRLSTVGIESSRVFWRSSPPGVDLLALFLPNPNHPFSPAGVSDWLASLPNGYLENVASIPVVLVATLAWAAWTGWRPSRWWAGVAALFGALALGPFVHVAGLNTFVPGALGASPLCANPRTGPVAHSLLRGHDTGRCSALRDRTRVDRPSPSPLATGRPRRRCRAARRGAAAGAADALCGDAAAVLRHRRRGPGGCACPRAAHGRRVTAHRASAISPRALSSSRRSTARRSSAAISLACRGHGYPRFATTTSSMRCSR